MATSKDTYFSNCSVEYRESPSLLLAILLIPKAIALLLHYIALTFVATIVWLMTIVGYLIVIFNPNIHEVYLISRSLTLDSSCRLLSYWINR